MNFELIAFGAGGPNGQPIAYLDLFEYQKDEEEQHENALADVRLICAAPELLEACKSLLMHIGLNAPDRISAQDPELIAARAAIAKAGGAA